MRLEILMGTQKSHSAYRLAWSNTTRERIPFLPLHCRDLASAEEGNPTYVDEGRNLINWKKFKIIGEVVISIKRSQAIPYSFTSRNEGAQRLILDSRFVKDDDVSAPRDGLVHANPKTPGRHLYTRGYIYLMAHHRSFMIVVFIWRGWVWVKQLERSLSGFNPDNLVFWSATKVASW